MGRRTNGSGSLKVRNGIYIARWMYNGKMNERSTHIRVDMVDKDGKPCGRESALAILASYTEPYKHKMEADALAVLSGRIKKERELGENDNPYDALILRKLPDAYEGSSRRNACTERHLESYKTILTEFSTWCGPNTLANSVTEKTAVRWADSIWKSGISATTFNIKICCMRVVWKTLKPLIGFSENPWSGIKKKKDGVHTRRPFTEDEVGSFFSVIGNRYGGDLHAMCMIGYHTGMRISDCSMLKWEDVNFEDNMIRVTTAKTGEKVDIPMHSQLREELFHHRATLTRQYEEAEETGWSKYWLSLPSTGQKGRVTNVVDKNYVDYVVPRMAERYVRDSTLLSTLIRKTLEKASLPTSKKEGQCVHARPVLGFHSFRHGLASRLAEAGVPQVIAMLLLGHRNATVHNAYRHTNDAFLKMEFAKLEKKSSAN